MLFRPWQEVAYQGKQWERLVRCSLTNTGGGGGQWSLMTSWKGTSNQQACLEIACRPRLMRWRGGSGLINLCGAKCQLNDSRVRESTFKVWQLWEDCGRLWLDEEENELVMLRESWNLFVRALHQEMFFLIELSPSSLPGLLNMTKDNSWTQIQSAS